MAECNVCEGSGEYPIHARGKYVYNITCPDCDGDGLADASGEIVGPTLGELVASDANQPVK